MRILALYTLARLALFAAVFGVLWLVFGRELDWTAATALYLALIALVVSSLIAFVALRGLRNRLALQLAERSERARAKFRARRAAEDDH